MFDDSFSAVFATCVLAALIAWVMFLQKPDSGSTEVSDARASQPRSVERTEPEQEERHERSPSLTAKLPAPQAGEIKSTNAEHVASDSQPLPSSDDVTVDGKTTAAEAGPPAISTKVADSQRPKRTKYHSAAGDRKAGTEPNKTREIIRLPHWVSSIIRADASPTLPEVASTTSSAARPSPQTSVMNSVTCTPSSYSRSLGSSGSDQDEK